MPLRLVILVAAAGESQNMAIGKQLFDQVMMAMQLIQDSCDPWVERLFENPALLVR